MTSPLGNLSEELPEIGDECIRAWRHWSVSAGDLRSLNEGIGWPYLEPFEAICGRQQDHTSPDRLCECGIYVAKTLGDLSNSGYGLDKLGSTHAIGRVKIWGKIIPHDRGYRAQYAYPELVLCANPLVADLISRNYRCEVIITEIEHITEKTAPQTFPTQYIIQEAGIQTNVKTVIINWHSPSGQYYQYNGPFDATSIGRWFAAILAQLANNNGMLYNTYSQIQITFAT